MKKIILFLLGTFIGFAIAAQPSVGSQRQLPNQFRDFVDHQQRLNLERPQIEKKDGKVIITMSEIQFNKMRQIRQSQRFRQARSNQHNCCNNCQMRKPKPHRGPIHNRF